MPDLRERFIELALHPLAGKSPAEDLARGELMERLNHSRPGTKDDSLETATARQEAPAGRFLHGGKQTLLMLLAFTALLGAMSYSSWRDLVRIDYFYNVVPGDIGHFDYLKAAERELEAKVADNQRLFLFANCETMGEELRETWRQRCEESLPDDPAWLEEYVAAYSFRNRAGSPSRSHRLPDAGSFFHHG